MVSNEERPCVKPKVAPCLGVMTKRNLALLNAVFIFIFLNIWDYLLSRDILNAMITGIFMFGPSMVLWFIAKIKGEILITLISIFEFVVMLVFVLEGFQLAGVANTTKAIFWVPFLLMAGVNSFWGLKFYSEHREKLEKKAK